MRSGWNNAAARRVDAATARRVLVGHGREQRLEPDDHADEHDPRMIVTSAQPIVRLRIRSMS